MINPQVLILIRDSPEADSETKIQVQVVNLIANNLNNIRRKAGVRNEREGI
jgi:hypothetical protein